MPPRTRKPAQPSAAGQTPKSPKPESTSLSKLLSLSEIERIRGALLRWYRHGHRDMPWRKLSDPYAIWVSEIMLQQTRVETVAPRFLRWMARFPTVARLADAPLDDVLAEWSGLGYYARARNLHAAAQQIVSAHGGRVPDELDAVLALPGVGRYTAGAILSIAYGKPVPILDGNVERVVARLFCVDGDPARTDVRARLWALAGRLVEGAEDPSAVNQGLMELGAVLCSPRRPGCLTCPLSARCAARRAGEAERYPEPTRKNKVTPVEIATIALVRDGTVLLAQRPPDGLWGGLFELPSGELTVGESPLGAARRVAKERVGLEAEDIAPFPPPDDRFVQELSHLRVTFHAFRAVGRGRVRRSGYDAHQWIDIRRARLLGISRSTHRLLAALAALDANAARAAAGGPKESP